MDQLVSTSLSFSSTEELDPYPTPSIDYQIESPRFSVNDGEQIEQGIEHLNEHGYAVFSNVLSPNEIISNIDLLWQHFDGLSPPIKRDDAKTWDIGWPGLPHLGLLPNEGFAQSQFMWSVRGNPNVKKVFSKIWQTSELLVSFDAAGCFRDWHLNARWKTISAWYHCDQNPIHKSDRCSIQGFVSMTDNDELTGGLVVVPQSHKHFKELRSVIRTGRGQKNYVRVDQTHPLLIQFQPRLIKCKAGDLVVFDSRCIHCNTPALDTTDQAQQMTSLNEDKCPRLLRIVAYVCMSPTAMVPSDKVEDFRKTRKELVIDRMACTHWPAELNFSGGPQFSVRQPLHLSTYQQSLIVGTNVDPEDETARTLTEM